MSQPVSGTIVNYRIGTNSQMPRWCLIQIGNAHSSSEVGQLVGRKVVVSFEENKFVGKILGVHGKNGVVKAKFNRGLPGKAIGAVAEIIG